MLCPRSADAEEFTTDQGHRERIIHLRFIQLGPALAVRVLKSCNRWLHVDLVSHKLNGTKCARLQTRPSLGCDTSLIISAMDADDKGKIENVEKRCVR